MLSHTASQVNSHHIFWLVYKQNFLVVQNLHSDVIMFCISQRLWNSPAAPQLLFHLFVYMGVIPCAVFTSLLFSHLLYICCQREIYVNSLLTWKVLPPLFAAMSPFLPLYNAFHFPNIKNSTFYTLRFCKFTSCLLPVWGHSVSF